MKIQEFCSECNGDGVVPTNEDCTEFEECDECEVEGVVWVSVKVLNNE